MLGLDTKLLGASITPKHKLTYGIYCRGFAKPDHALSLRLLTQLSSHQYRVSLVATSPFSDFRPLVVGSLEHCFPQLDRHFVSLQSTHRTQREVRHQRMPL